MDQDPSKGTHDVRTEELRRLSAQDLTRRWAGEFLCFIYKAQQTVFRAVLFSVQLQHMFEQKTNSFPNTCECSKTEKCSPLH